MQGKVSVIVPVYNVDIYIEKCVTSILNQTFENIEVILVDDGSTDFSGEICDKFAAQDERIKVLHKTNGGLSDARNVALNILTGQYICFIDSDDFVDAKMLQDTVTIIEKEKADIVISNHFINTEEMEKLFYEGNDYIVLNSEKAIQLVFEGRKSTVIACSKLYKKEIFQNLRFPVGKICEDGFVIVDVLDKANKIVYDSRAYYHYLTRSGSISNSIYSAKELDIVDAYVGNLEKIRMKYPKIIKYGWFRYFAAINSVLYKMVKSNLSYSDDDFQKLRNIIILNRKRIFTLPVLSMKRKIMMFLLILSPPIYIAVENSRVRE